ncbi:hypothetical protein [Synechococcus sp. RS9902]|uniref:hypothetical protein n=1 Tax=Synechococcus sp. RS9902 TaxID=221345 RepID=UPI0018620249|nr:hypothetical protein [Synechococcus sp. RS9902]QNI98420.1 hypothetical protein SynRS9902_02549 [Synechococcus sp. RS9902]
MELQKGDVVRLAQSVTMAEFGLALCDDDGAGLEIDGVVVQTAPHMVNVRIRRLMGSSSICGPTEGSVSRWVRRHEVLEVIEGEPHLWPNAAGLKAVSDKREGKVKRQPEPVFWTVGVDEIPGD